MGTDTIFKKEHVSTLVPMDDDKIYLIYTSHKMPIEVLPFFRMMPGPKDEKNACYYYNKVEKDGIRWISYHFDKEAERTEPDQALIEIIRYLEGD